VETGLDQGWQAPPPPEQWVGRVRYVVVPILAVIAIAAAIYLLEEKPSETDVAEVQTQGQSGVASGSARPVQVTASSEELARTPAPRIGYPAPDFTLTDLEGKPTRLSDFRGQTVFLNFFATWCPPCRAEMPDILATHEENRMKGATVLAVDLQEDAKTVRNYADSVGLTFPIVLDRTGRVSALYRITALPTSFFIDKDGMIRDMQIGALSKSLMETRLRKALEPDRG
jgi:peroxiredoxin